MKLKWIGRDTAAILVASVLCSCGARPHHPSSPSAFKVVTIGSQIWMAENLDVDHYRSGAPIEECRDWKAFNDLGSQSKGCWISFVKSGERAGARTYDISDNDSNPVTYGTFYNYYAVHDERGLCPVGWHVPNDGEWNALIATLGPDAAKKAKSTTGWATGGPHGDVLVTGNGNGTNESGFNALPAGNKEDDWFHWHGYAAYWWSSSEVNAEKVSLYSIYHGEPDKHKTDELIAVSSLNYRAAASVRCVKDQP